MQRSRSKRSKFGDFSGSSKLCGNIVSSVPPHPPTHLFLIYILGLSSVKEGGGLGGCWKASGGRGGSETSEVFHMFFFHYK